jgi:L-aspartate oxidase
VACSGVHGANRLASNSLLEGLVFSRRIAEVLPGELRPDIRPPIETRRSGLVAADIFGALQNVMSERVGVLRTAGGLAGARRELGAMATTTGDGGRAAWEATNLLTVGSALALAAQRRRETRGSHWREDFPHRDDAHCAGHLDVVMAAGRLTATFRALAPTCA